MTTLLFPTDFSEAANRAFIYALKLADKLDASIVTLHVFARPDISGLSHIPRSLEEVYENIDLEVLDEYRKAVPGMDTIQQENGMGHVNVTHTMHEGDTVKVIIERAAAENAGLIVMGTTGARGLKEILLGSVAGEVLENAPCPVLAVPEQAVFDGVLDNIAFTTTFSEEDERGLRKVLALLGTFKPNIHCINVDLAHTASYLHKQEAFMAKFEDVDDMSVHVLDGTDFSTTLTDFLETSTIDLLVMVTHKRTFWDELFNYSKTKTLSYHSSTPIMSLPSGILA
jgi:nucleotide-binding universal stress UspA family protein